MTSRILSRLFLRKLGSWIHFLFVQQLGQEFYNLRRLTCGSVGMFLTPIKRMKQLTIFFLKLTSLREQTTYHDATFGFPAKWRLTNKRWNRPPTLKDHVTNSSYTQWVRILLMPKIDWAHMNYLTPQIREKTYLREIFHGTLIFYQSSMICIGRLVGGHTLALQHGCQTTFCLYRQMFNSYAQMCCKRYHITFSTFPLKFKCEICVQKEVIHNFFFLKKSHLITWPATNVLILRKWCRFEKPNLFNYFLLSITHLSFSERRIM